VSFGHITVVNVDGRGGELLGAQLALAHSARELPGATALLLSPQCPSRLLPGIKHISIQPLGYFEYGLFVIYALHSFISTDFALIVQDDGWVLDGRQWQESFCDYDYIGAPINFARVADGKGTRYIRGYEWAGLLGEPSAQVHFVMNGGLCLRSRRLLELPTKLRLPYVLQPVSGLQGPPYRMRWTSESQLEDVQLCIDMRLQLERSGMRFAPIDVARQFAFEHLHPGIHDDLNLMQVLGHHSKLRKLTSLDPMTVHYQIPQSELDRIYGERQIAEAYQKRGYRVEFLQA
jgi:hypothetical protein